MELRTAAMLEIASKDVQITDLGGTNAQDASKEDNMHGGKQKGKHEMHELALEPLQKAKRKATIQSLDPSEKVLHITIPWLREPSEP